jgi:hypothetical protein
MRPAEHQVQDRGHADEESYGSEKGHYGSARVPVGTRRRGDYSRHISLLLRIGSLINTPAVRPAARRPNVPFLSGQATR